MKPLLAWFLLAVTLANGATAQPVVWIERDNWWVATLGQGCAAGSGRPLEKNHTPYLQLQFRMQGRDVIPDVWFWPGAVTGRDTATLTLVLTAPDGAQVAVPAINEGGAVLRGAAPISRRDLRGLRGARHLTVEAAGTNARFLVEMSPTLGELLSSLDTCAQALGQ